MISFADVGRTYTTRDGKKWTYGKPEEFFFGEIQRLGQDVVRLHNFTNNQVRTYRGDGTSSVELLRQESVLTDDGSLEYVDRPELILEREKNGRIRVRHWPSGRTFSTDAPDERDRLSRNGTTLIVGSQEITVDFSGERIYVDDRGAGGRLVTDSGGRMLECQTPSGTAPFAS